METFKPTTPEDPKQVGPYRILARLGAGGMGSVYLGRSRSGRVAAVKVVRPELADDPEFRRRFEREAAASQQVNGAYTAAVVDADPTARTPWLATAFVRGTPLTEAVAAHGAWPERSVVALGAGLAEALHAIHLAGVVHRDLKPSNILLAPDGPRVIDFGISVMGDATALTQSGVILGSAGFMSPEQVLGQRIGPASDIFALGAVLTFAATAVGPFGTGTLPVLCFRTAYEAPDLSRLPRSLAEVVSRCLSKDERQRPTAAALLDQLAQDAGGSDDIASVLAGNDWVPAPVAATIAALPEVPHVPLPSLSEEETRTGAPGAGPAASSDGSLPASAQGNSPKESTGRGTPTRRWLLLSGGAAVAGALGITGWQLRDNGGSTAGDRSGGLGSTESRWMRKIRGGDNSDPELLPPDKLLYTDDSRLVAVRTTDGKREWAYRIDNTSEFMGGTGKFAYMAMPNRIEAVDVSKGRKAWGRFFPMVTDSSDPLVTEFDNDVVCLAGEGNLFLLSASTGESIKERKIGGDEAGATVDLVLNSGTVYVRTEQILHTMDSRTGKERWRRSLTDLSSTPVIADGKLFIVIGNRLYALGTRTGGEHWNVIAGRGASAAGDVRDFDLAVAGGLACVMTEQELQAFDANTGRKKWNLRLPYPDGVAVHYIPQFGMMLISSPADIRAVDPKSGKVTWTFKMAVEVGSSRARTVDGVTYIGGDSVMHALDTKSGEKKWEFTADGKRPVSTPVASRGTVYFRSDTALYAVEG
ncbi:protein kinase domain-containing protein [Streptomyces cacaoi]|uniref:Protein kinase domain-containing protein n=2 Tax=Streptomyces TaxID=1883 RepID=A0A4Y3QRJ7_STRCI|nr:PQQ-binding-like beta-propeller repeat protein [Streptomyces cacaoi]NNG85101.1 PQQ-binding-like beta-propeller repeat protein [Streptomyces cacaoi]GEB47915.1 hypothetical protein SCA03_04660 [Streptomyces cacaoi]